MAKAPSKDVGLIFRTHKSTTTSESKIKEDCEISVNMILKRQQEEM